MPSCGSSFCLVSCRVHGPPLASFLDFWCGGPAPRPRLCVFLGPPHSALCRWAGGSAARSCGSPVPLEQQPLRTSAQPAGVGASVAFELFNIISVVLAGVAAVCPASAALLRVPFARSWCGATDLRYRTLFFSASLFLPCLGCNAEVFVPRSCSLGAQCVLEFAMQLEPLAFSFFVLLGLVPCARASAIELF